MTIVHFHKQLVLYTNLTPFLQPPPHPTSPQPSPPPCVVCNLHFNFCKRYLYLHSLDANKVILAPSLPGEKLEPRILLFSSSLDSPLQYVTVMNAIFAATKLVLKIHCILPNLT